MRNFESSTSRVDANGVEIHICDVVKAKNLTGIVSRYGKRKEAYIKFEGGDYVPLNDFSSSELEILTGQAVYDYWWRVAHRKESSVCG